MGTKQNKKVPEVQPQPTEPTKQYDPPTPRYEVVNVNAESVMHAIETYKSMIFVSVVGLFSLLFANLTGFVFSLMAYKGQMVALWFAMGVFLAIGCFFVSYQTQTVLYQEDMGRCKVGDHMQWVKVGATVAALSLLCFAAGVIAVVR